ncbi:MAG: sensor histidine kinase [Alkalispirochaetaceae bacterium]
MDNEPLPESVDELRAEIERLKRENARLKAINVESVGILFFDMESTFLDANDAFLKMIGYDRKALVRGELRSDLVTLPEWMPRTAQVFEELKETGRFKPYEKELRRPDGSRWWGLFAGAKIGENEAVEFVIDITERKKAEAEREAALEAQERLMQELNHRVKNHLFMVATLVSLKDATIGDAADLSDIRGQVNTIAHLHDKLHENRAVTSVAIGPYLRDLLAGLFSLYSGPRVAVRVDVGAEELQTSTAAALGLILNELATNAMKHGFPGVESPRFTVALQEGADGYLLTVEQNGRPLEASIMESPAENSGFGLVMALVEEIGGAIEIEEHPNPLLRITIPASAVESSGS